MGAVSGIRVMTSQGIDRRARFILAIALSFGLGTTIRKDWLTSSGFLDCDSIESSGTKGLCRAARETMGTGYAIGCLVALFLNAVLPEDIESMEEEEALPLTENEGKEEPAKEEAPKEEPKEAAVEEGVEEKI